MKKVLQLSLIGFMLIGMQFNASSQTVDSIIMDQGYANDVYYSFYYGEVKTEPRSNWDIAFYTSIFSAGIITNDGSGVELYAYPNADTSGWNNIDTTGLSTWPKLYNSEEDWEEGAFNRNGFGQLDYGWGIYNFMTHDVVGDSLFIIKLTSGEFKKLWIERKNSQNNIYFFRYGNLDNSMEVAKEYDFIPYLSKNFIYYSFENDELIDREPASDSWDILWTKYIAAQPSGAVYPVTGILSNVSVANNRFDGVPLTYSDYEAKPMDTLKAGIGFNWKTLVMSPPFHYEVVDSLVFFVKDYYGDKYKLYFNSFEIGTGKTVFTKELVYSTSVADVIEEASNLSIAPNPVSNELRFTYAGNVENMEAFVYDLSGRVVHQKKFSSTSFGEYSIPVDQLQSGMYLLLINTEKGTETQKFSVN